MENENKPLVEVKPGDPITAGRFNGMQKSLRQEHIQHTHTGAWKDGLFDGAPIGSDGLADGAVTGPKIAATAELTVRSLAAASAALTGALKVDADAALGGSLQVGTNAAIGGALQVGMDAAIGGSLRVGTDAAIGGSLKVERAAQLTGDLKVGGEATLAALNVGGKSTLADVAVASLAASGTLTAASLSVTGDLKVGNLLDKLDVAESSAAILRCTDLTLGHSTRRGTPGRALVDASWENHKRLVLNFEGDWNDVLVQSPLLIEGKPAVVVEGPRVRIVWGIVDENGYTIAGNGFSTARDTDFTWVTIENPRFNSAPSVIVQQLGEGRTTDNALVEGLKSYTSYPHRFSVMTGDSGGNRCWRAFCFIAIGHI